MLKPLPTVSVVFVQGMLSGVGYPRADCRQWLVDSGIAPGLLREPAARVTAAQYVALFGLLMDRLDDEFLGFLSRPLHIGSLGLIMRSTLGARSVDHALHRIAGTFRLLQDDLDLVHSTDEALSGLRLDFKKPDRADRTFLHELLLRVFWRLVVWLHGGRLKPARFDFALPEPAHVREYRKVFPGTIRFDRPHTALWFETSRLAGPMLRDDTAIRGFLAQAPGIVIIPQRVEHAISARVRSWLESERPRWPDLAESATALHRSSSSLQRQLAAEGTTFQALKDQLRRDHAIVRLNTSDVALTALALELGFADGPAFQRAFKVWTGSPPGAYRRISRGMPEER